MHGTPKQREAALRVEADIYLINSDGVKWLQLQKLPDVQALVVDESTAFKSFSAKRTKAILKLAPKFSHRVILTGTPVPNTMMDIFSQMFVADLGHHLGKAISHFRRKYFLRGGFKGYDWIIRSGAKEQIERDIAPACYRLDTSQILKMPPLLVNNVYVDMPTSARAAYKRLEKEMFIELDGGNATAMNAGAKYLLCRQVANGAVYTEEDFDVLHDTKLDAVESLREELSGKNVLVAYQFNSDVDRLVRKFRNVEVVNGKTSGKATEDIVRRWNQGTIPFLAVQPQAMSHGVNLQQGGNDVIWYGVTDNLEIYLQFNARLHRQGVVGSVRVHRILARGTVDEPIADRIDRKEATQQSMLDALRKYRHETS